MQLHLFRDTISLVYVTIALSSLSFFLKGWAEPWVHGWSSKIFQIHWGAWMALYQKHGLVAGFYAAHDVYPPLTFSMLAGLSLLPGETYLHFKAAQLILTFASAMIVLVWSRNIALAVGTLVALTPNSIIYESVDIFFTPFLIGALIAAAQRSWFWFSLLYSAALMIKYQPIVLAVFFLIWMLPDLKARKTWIALALGAGVVVVPVIAVFGFRFVMSLLQAAGAQFFFSANAYNLNWIAGSIYHFVTHEHGLAVDLVTHEHGHPSVMTKIPREMWMAAKVISLTSFAALVALFAASPRKPRNLFLFCGLGFLSYFMLHTEVHENHLHVTVVCFAVLVAASARHVPTFIFWSAAAAVNLMMILTAWPRTVVGFNWIFLIAAINVVMFVSLYVDTAIEVLRTARSAGGERR